MESFYKSLNWEFEFPVPDVPKYMLKCLVWFSTRTLVLYGIVDGNDILRNRSPTADKWFETVNSVISNEPLFPIYNGTNDT